MCVHGRICPTREVGGAEAKTEAEVLGRWAGLGSKQRRSYWGGQWESGGKHMRSYWGGGRGWGESRGGVTLDLGVAGEKAEEELLGRWTELG